MFFQAVGLMLVLVNAPPIGKQLYQNHPQLRKLLQHEDYAKHRRFVDQIVEARKGGTLHRIIAPSTISAKNIVLESHRLIDESFDSLLANYSDLTHHRDFAPGTQGHLFLQGLRINQSVQVYPIAYRVDTRSLTKIESAGGFFPRPDHLPNASVLAHTQGVESRGPFVSLGDVQAQRNPVSQFWPSIQFLVRNRRNTGIPIYMYELQNVSALPIGDLAPMTRLHEIVSTSVSYDSIRAYQALQYVSGNPAQIIHAGPRTVIQP